MFYVEPKLATKERPSRKCGECPSWPP